ncbi:carbon catabolite repressor protein 4 homolog 3 [Impatiens glandulifera]|uniref:carbon catabolite repressor protein 4 homolog 3 n=1 Tax=Impatiens glandulifera TaxID=253017 RepID=UPI001FB0F463|nr:carbon catabolite repressor protein 4 homolog 3 [Impatiens glandulifera]
MRRLSPSTKYFASAASTETPIMSSRPFHPGGRYQRGRGFSCRPTNADVNGHLVTGDSHFQSVQESNRGFRPVPRTNNVSYHRPYQYNQRPHLPSSHPQYKSHPMLNASASPYNPMQSSNFQPSAGHAVPYFYQNQQFQRPQQQFQPRKPRPPVHRNWELSNSELAPECERFKVLSYNLLADYLAINHQSKLYFHIPPYMLDWQWRKRNIIFELKELWSADILCLQEVDRFLELENELKYSGYSGIWKMRTGDPVDGCAIFWRVSRFKLLHEEHIEFKKFGLRDNVAQICVFESLDQNCNKNPTDMASQSLRSASSNKLVVCNTHILFNPKRGEMKLGQIRNLLEKAYATSKHWNDAPVVICGDFNCTPKSPLYNYISNQQINLADLPRDKLSGQASAELQTQRQFNSNFRPDLANNHIRPTLTTVDHIKLGHVYKSLDIKLDKTDECKDEILSISSTPGTKENSTTDEISCQLADVIAKVPESLISSQSDATSSEFPNGTQVSSSSKSEENPSTISDAGEKSNPSLSYVPSIVQESTDCSLRSGEKMESLSIDEPDIDTNEGDISEEDSVKFLLELHDNDGGVPLELNPSIGSSIRESDNSVVESAMRFPYDPSAWTPMEIKAASGNEECTLVEHPLKLSSTYTEVQDHSGSRDSNGEPLATSYNKCFLGTVDYIWRSEGLQTVGVLAPIPKDVMIAYGGFPTKKWGSDHIALVTELAFTKDVNPRSNQETA